MLQIVIRQLWNEKRHTVWLLLELTVVFLFLLMEVDFSWIKLKNYREPVGFDLSNTYQLNLKRLVPGAVGYQTEEEQTLAEAEMLDQLIGQVRLYPDVETVGLSHMASPVASGGWWTKIYRRDSLGECNVQKRMIDADYLQVFRLRQLDGKPIEVRTADSRQLLVSEEACKRMGYTDIASVTRDKLYEDVGDNQRDSAAILAVYGDLKSQRFRPYYPSFFEIPTRLRWNEYIQEVQAQEIEVWVRVREGREAHFREFFEREMGERLWSGQIYVSSVASVQQEDAKQIEKELRLEIEPMAYVLLFVLLTAFLGVFGTFWLRTRQRRSEIGIRMAMGASKRSVWQLFFLEGVCLTMVAMLPALVIYVNLLHADVLNTYDLPFTMGRVLLVFVFSLVILLVMIMTGIYIPARNAACMEPADALHCE